jgi:hypothetical protein
MNHHAQLLLVEMGSFEFFAQAGLPRSWDYRHASVLVARKLLKSTSKRNSRKNITNIKNKIRHKYKYDIK